MIEKGIALMNCEYVLGISFQQHYTTFLPQIQSK